MTLKIPLAFLGRSLINDFRVTESYGRNAMTDYGAEQDRSADAAAELGAAVENTMPAPGPNLPFWKCHKIVQAWAIRAWYAEPPSGGEGNRIIYLEDGPYGQQYPAFMEPHTLFARYQPVPGDYFVIYDDGYKSISPKKAFEEGYDRLDPVPPSSPEPPNQDLLPQEV